MQDVTGGSNKMIIIVDIEIICNRITYYSIFKTYYKVRYQYRHSLNFSVCFHKVDLYFHHHPMLTELPILCA